MEVDIRKNYLEARELVAKELKEKYNLVESYRDNDRLTLDSSNYSIHLTFYLPDGDDVSVSEKGKEPGHGHNFMHYLFKKYPDDKKRTELLKELYKNSRASGPFDYSVDSIQDNLSIMTNFVGQYYPVFFL